MISRTKLPRRSSMLAFAVLISMLLWSVAIFLGVTEYASVAKDGPDVACLMRGPGNNFSQLPESIYATGTWELFPLGLECAYTAPDVEEALVVAPNPLLTGAIMAAALVTIITLTVALNPRKTAK